jgi:hypothetical protein
MSAESAKLSLREKFWNASAREGWKGFGFAAGIAYAAIAICEYAFK